MIKKLFIFILLNIFFVFYANAEDKLDISHEIGLQFTGSYDYNEPEFMHNKSELGDYWFDNFGLVYNLKGNFLINDFLTEFELDTDFRRIKYDYWSNSTGTLTHKDNDTFNIRALYGFQLTDKLMLKLGLGYRSLKDPGGGTTTTTGNWGYDRIQEYRYVPILAELNMPISSIDGKLKLEYDHVFYGYNASLLGVGGGANKDLHFKNSDGYMVKVSYKIPYEGFYFEPYYEFQSIEESTLSGTSYEPSNTTDEFGIKLTKKFGDDKIASFVKAKRIEKISDNYYFGFGFIKTEIDSGISSLTGTATLDEDDWGERLYAGINLFENLDLEFAFNKFGVAVLSGNTSDTFISDGRFKKHNSAPGSTWTINVNQYSTNIHSNSVSAAIKPKYNFTINNDLEVGISGQIGITGWDQSETHLTAGSDTSVYDYSGYDGFYGIGVTAQTKALSFSLEYHDYDMFYDAKAVGLSISYKF
mgnify:CR=1 FL=1|tara:strand:+ start:2530 stop:3945 length:1416 start_codon:yes stop_codon:yes gene_type:complete